MLRIGGQRAPTKVLLLLASDALLIVLGLLIAVSLRFQSTPAILGHLQRPETLEVGSNRLAGLDPERVVRAMRKMLQRPRCWANPFGDGRAGARVVRILERAMQPSANSA